MEQGPDSALRMMQKFHNFWSNVTKIDIRSTCPRDTAVAILEGMNSVQPDDEQRKPRGY